MLLPMQPVHLQLLAADNTELAAAKYLAEYLRTTVAQDRTLLLLSGGSAITMYAQMLQLLAKQGGSLKGTTISLVDERFVPAGHADSNAQQLTDAGVIKMIKNLDGQWLPYLTKNQETAEAAALRMTTTFQQLQKTQQIIVLAGLGDDAHSAGLLPTKDTNIIKRVYQSKQPIVYYELAKDTDNPYRYRLTTTPSFLAQAQQIIVYATGSKKRNALARLLAGTETIHNCPALVLRNSNKPLLVLTDNRVG